MNLYFLLFHRITVAAGMVEKERSRRLSTATLNQVVSEAVAFKQPPRTRGGKRGRVFYCTQVLIEFCMSLLNNYLNDFSFLWDMLFDNQLDVILRVMY